MKQKITALLCTLALCLALISPVQGNGFVYFTAINDNLLPLSSSTMPVWSDGTLYLPWTTFDGASSGIDIGVYGAYSKANSTVTLYNLRNILIFDLEQGNSRDHHSQTIYPSKVILQNGMPYVPVSMVTSFFDLNYNILPTDYGTLIRITNDNAVLSDDIFIDAAAALMDARLQEYHQSNIPPVVPPDPDVAPPPPVSPDKVSAYLAFRYEGDTDGTDAILDILAINGQQAVFFFPPDAILKEGDLIRRLLGTSHSVGILAEGNTLDETSILLEEGNSALVSVARTRTTLALAPEDQQSALADEGFVIWQETAQLTPNTDGKLLPFARGLIQYLPLDEGSVYLTFDTGLDVGENLATLLRLLASQQFVVTTPLETQL